MGRQDYILTATDSDTPANVARLVISTTVNPASTLAFATNSIDYTFYVGQSKKVTLPAARGGAAPVIYSIAPATGNGFTFNRDTRELASTASTAAAAQTSYTLTARDDSAPRQTDTMTINVTVLAQQPPPTPQPHAHACAATDADAAASADIRAHHRRRDADANARADGDTRAHANTRACADGDACANAHGDANA